VSWSIEWKLDRQGNLAMRWLLTGLSEVAAQDRLSGPRSWCVGEGVHMRLAFH
jgi:hypothetical protein